MDKPFRRWCTAGGGILSIPLVALAVIVVVVAAALVTYWLRAVWGWLMPGGDERPILVGLTVICVALSLALLEAPIFSYVKIGQAKRIQLISSYFSAAVIVRYFDQFWSNRDGFGPLVDRWKNGGRQIDDELKKDLHTKFNELLQDDFGLRIYVVPAVLLTAIAVIVLFFGFYGGIQLAQEKGNVSGKLLPAVGLPLDLVSIAAIFGAYTWITSDCITRNYQGALHPSDLSWYALRLVVAVPLGEAISMVTVKDAGLINPGTSGAVLAFVISMFSFERISQILASVANKALGAPAGTPAECDDVVIRLPGVDETVSNRLGAEGIATIAQMAAADPIRVSIRASQPFDYVLGLIDAALLWNYVGSKVEVLRAYGFKGISGLLAYHDHLLTQEAPTETQLADYATTSRAAAQAQAAEAAALRLLQDAKRNVLAATTAKNDADRALVALQNDINAKVPGAEAQLAAATAAKLAADAGLANAMKALEDSAALVKGCRDGLALRLRELAAARGALIGSGTLLADAAKKAGLDESGLRNIIEQVGHDEYADFIRHLMWVAPEQRDDRVGAPATPPGGSHA